MPYPAADGKAHWLLVRRSMSEPAERAYYRVSGPAATTLLEMVRAAGSRWAIEVGFEEAKSLMGVDEYEVRTWQAWHTLYSRYRLRVTTGVWAAITAVPHQEPPRQPRP